MSLVLKRISTRVEVATEVNSKVNLFVIEWNTDHRDSRDSRDQRESREYRDNRSHRDHREHREREPREPRDHRSDKYAERREHRKPKELAPNREDHRGPRKSYFEKPIEEDEDLRTEMRPPQNAESFIKDINEKFANVCTLKEAYTISNKRLVFRRAGRKQMLKENALYAAQAKMVNRARSRRSKTPCWNNWSKSLTRKGIRSATLGMQMLPLAF